SLTAIGKALCDPKQETSAKAQAFLAVPLYRRIYDEFKSGVLPPTNEAIENAIVGVGVAKKVKDKARQTFQRSAQQAGLFWAGNDRRVMPKGSEAVSEEPIVQPEGGADSDAENKSKSNRTGGGGIGRGQLIEGLIEKLPMEGADFSLDDRARWLQLAAGIFD